jgi:hypothetical protein
MIERAVNLTWILVGAAAAVLSLRIGLYGPYGPGSGLFPFVAGLLVSAAGVALFVSKSQVARDVVWPDRAGWRRILGVIAGLAFMAIAIPWLGFAVAGFLTMLILLRTVEESRWLSSIVLSLVSVCVVLFLFGYLLELQLPRGPWGF